MLGKMAKKKDCVYHCDLIELSSDENNSNHSICQPDGVVPESSDCKEARNEQIVAAVPGSSGSEGVSQKQTGSKGKKTKKKSNTATNKEAKKIKLAEEKAAKKEADELNKIYKPAECMKYINVEGHPSLWSSWWCSDVNREVTTAGARVVQASELCHPSLVVWSRNVPRTIDKNSGQLKLTSSVEPCGRALYVTTAEDVAEHVVNHTLASHLSEIKLLANCSVTLVLFGVKEYFKASRRKTSNSNRNSMTEIELELAITDVLVSSECDTAIVNTPNELALLIVQFTKAIAEAPFKKAKRQCEERAGFYMKGDNKNCVAVDKDGIGASRLWQQMVAILPHSSLDVSRALCAQYSSPLALYEALQLPNCINEIADIGVSRTAVLGSKTRRVGPEFARKLNILFTSDDGNTLVD